MRNDTCVAGKDNFFSIVTWPWNELLDLHLMRYKHSVF